MKYKLKVKPSKIQGFGLFAAERIPWGEKIIEYEGEIISDTEARHRMKKGADYIFELGRDRNIDGAVKGNDARFINHSKKNPNCVVLREDGHIWIVAGIEGIERGEELTYEYGSSYYS